MILLVREGEIGHGKGAGCSSLGTEDTTARPSDVV